MDMGMGWACMWTVINSHWLVRNLLERSNRCEIHSDLNKTFFLQYQDQGQNFSPQDQDQDFVPENITEDSLETF